jgi:hypothetical protein
MKARNQNPGVKLNLVDDLDVFLERFTANEA